MAISEPGNDVIPLPEALFNQVVASTADLAELKAVLYIAAFAHSSGRPTVPMERMLEADVLGAVAPDVTPEPAESRVTLALERAVVNGSLLQVRVGREPRLSVHYLLNTEQNRRLLEALTACDPEVGRSLRIAETEVVEIYRPNAFALYERWIGPLTPLIAEKLRHAERAYPREWIESALRLAAAAGHPSWRYAEAILDRWEAEGGPPG
jgi:DNA replication protein